MLAIELPDDVEVRLDALAKAEGRTKVSCVLDVRPDRLENLADQRVAKERLVDIEAGKTATFLLADVMRKLGLG